MYKFKIITTRPDTTNPFFVNSPAAAQYEQLAETAMAARPTEGDEAFLGLTRTESADGLTLTTELNFNTENGKIALLAAYSILLQNENITVPYFDARNAYNNSVGHTLVITGVKEQPTV